MSASPTRGEFRNGWPMLLGSTLGLSLGIAALQLYVGGLFALPLARSIGLSRSAFGLGILLSTVGMSLAHPVFGHAIDRRGPRGPVLLAFVAMAVVFTVLASMTYSVATYLALQFLLGLVAAGSAPMGFVRAVSERFLARRGLALGILASGIGLSAAIVPPIVANVIAVGGWRAGYLALAVLALVGTIPTLLALPRGGNRVARAEAAGEGALLHDGERRTFVLMLVAFAAMAIGFAGMLSHYVPMMIGFGVDPVGAAELASAIGVSVAVSRLVVGWLIDRVFAPYVAAAICLFCAAGSLMLLLGGAAMAIPAAIAFGTAIGGESDMIGFLVARYFGIGRLGRLYGRQYAAFILAAGLSPFWIGISFDLTGGYALALTISLAVMIGAAALFMLLPRYPEIAR